MKRNTVNGACNENVSFMVHITKKLPVLVTIIDMVLTKQEAMAGATLIFLTSPGKITRQLLEEKVALKRAEGSAIRRCLRRILITMNVNLVESLSSNHFVLLAGGCLKKKLIKIKFLHLSLLG